MQRYNGQLINQFANVINGNAAAGALVTVRLKETGATVTLYATDDIGGATLANPLTADAKGYYGFYAPDGVYTLDVSISGTPQLEIQLQDVAALQAQFDAALANAGYIPVGTFAAGCTVSQSNGVVSDGSSFWRWDGSFPKAVSAGSSPTPTGVSNWILISDEALRGDLAAADSTVLVGGVEASNLLGKEELAAGVERIKIVDFADTANHALSIVHFGEGISGTTQTYGIDISNRPDARTAIVVHQYSNVSPAVWIDNTDNQPALRIHNTSNPVLNPSGPTVSEGDYLHLQKAGSTVMRLTHTGTFSATNFSPIFLGNTGTALSVQTPVGVSQDTFTIIRDYPTNAGDAMQITCNGGTGLKVLKNGAGDGLDVVMSAGAAGSYCVKSQGYDYSLLATTTNNGGTTAQITKSGTGNGDALAIKNSGTGRSLRVTDATNAEKMSIYPDGKLNWVTSNSQTTVGAAGTASSLPAAPSLYLKVLFNGLEYVIPAYLA